MEGRPDGRKLGQSAARGVSCSSGADSSQLGGFPADSALGLCSLQVLTAVSAFNPLAAAPPPNQHLGDLTFDLEIRTGA